MSQLLSNSDAANASAIETDGNVVLTVNLTAKTPEQAEQIKNMLGGLKAFVELASKETPTAATLVRQVQVTQDGAKIVAIFKHEAKTLLETLQKFDQENKAKAAKAQAPAKPQ